MTDDRLREIARQYALKHFLDYEQRLRDAYARLQDQDTGRRVREDSVR
jgi:predicted transcriptional regulator